jgi:hypothetical protein
MAMSIGSSQSYSAPVSRPVSQPTPQAAQPTDTTDTRAASANSDALVASLLAASGIGTQVNKLA